MDLYSSKLYLFDSLLNECSARIISLSSSSSPYNKYGAYKLTLNHTIFHPQGGGQPSTLGKIFLATNKDIFFTISYVYFNSLENIIEHYGDLYHSNNDNKQKNDENDLLLFQEDIEVILEIDLELRKLHMKLHSGGHIIDSALKRLGYWNKLKSGKGYHFQDGPYVEYNSELTEEELNNLLALLNHEIQLIIEESIPSHFQMITKEEASILCDCDTTNYPDVVRVVEIAGHSCPCGGTHISNTNELRELKITRIKKKKNIIKISYEVN